MFKREQKTVERPFHSTMHMLTNKGLLLSGFLLPENLPERKAFLPDHVKLTLSETLKLRKKLSIPVLPIMSLFNQAILHRICKWWACVLVNMGCSARVASGTFFFLCFYFQRDISPRPSWTHSHEWSVRPGHYTPFISTMVQHAAPGPTPNPPLSSPFPEFLYASGPVCQCEPFSSSHSHTETELFCQDCRNVENQLIKAVIWSHKASAWWANG